MAIKKKHKEKFNKFKRSRRRIAYATAIKTPDKYPYLSTYSEDKVDFILLYNMGGFLIQIRDEKGRTRYIVPEEGMEPIIARLDHAEIELFEYLMSDPF